MTTGEMKNGMAGGEKGHFVFTECVVRWGVLKNAIVSKKGGFAYNRVFLLLDAFDEFYDLAVVARDFLKDV